MRIRPFAISLLAAILLPLSALASAWDASFSPSSVGSYLTAGGGTIVVGAGAPSTELADAEAALAGALRESGKTKPVMDDAALGDVSGLDDATIVAKAKNLPVKRIAVVRVFDGAKGEPPSAVVTFYDPAGELTGAFSIERGDALAAADQPAEEPGLGARSNAVAAVAEVTKSVTESTADAMERYELEYIWFQDWVGVNAQSGVVLGNWAVPYQGKYKKDLNGAEFYEVVGRSDLADSYRRTRNVRTGLYLGGSVLLLGGAALMVGSVVSEVCTLNDGPNCDDSAGSKLMTAGVITGAVGFIGILIAPFLNPHPVEAAEARRLADDYNKRLKQDLGLTAREEPKGLQLQPGFAVFPGGGGGITLSGKL